MDNLQIQHGYFNLKDNAFEKYMWQIFCRLMNIITKNKLNEDDFQRE